ncbi:hypothetical protein [Streptomyces cacaoi]|uniref:hypothetical protein n=1 Tax=Streptomyces cacaoi TaxID=1898 RepID=UPI00280B8348|nr:hypothetical protein [Streptomyces cacaoi]
MLTGDDRGAAEGSDIAYAQETLTALGFSFGGIAALTAVFTASGAVTLAVAQRRREFALLRAIAPPRAGSAARWPPRRCASPRSPASSAPCRDSGSPAGGSVRCATGAPCPTGWNCW